MALELPTSLRIVSKAHLSAPLGGYMFEDGVVTVFVSNMDTAVHFYTQVLGLKLENRFGNHWASIKAGKGLTIGLHPASEDSPAGIRGSISIGLQVSEPIQIVVSQLQKRGAKFNGPIVEDKSGQLAFLSDPDGNPLYLHELKAEYRSRHESVSA